jgi:hypothetical protein
MTGQNAEVAEYLGYLLAHARECRAEACRDCVTFHTILDGMKARLFFSNVYTKAVLQPALAASSPMRRARRSAQSRP